MLIINFKYSSKIASKIQDVKHSNLIMRLLSPSRIDREDAVFELLTPKKDLKFLISNLLIRDKQAAAYLASKTYFSKREIMRDLQCLLQIFLKDSYRINFKYENGRVERIEWRN